MLVGPLEVPKRYFEDVLQKTGWGLYYQFIVGFTSVNACVNAVAILSMSFALPLSTCDTILSKRDIKIAHVLFVLGRGIGGLLLCSIADNNGKKCMVPKTSIIIFGSCFVIAFSHNSYTLYLAGFLLGSGVQANATVMKIYLSEILPKEKRGYYLILPDIFWVLGCFALTVFSYFMMNAHQQEHTDMDMRLTIWRGIFAVVGGLSLSIACASALLEIGPRFLIFKGRIITAVVILKQFYAINRSKYSETCEIESQDLYNLIRNYDINIDPEPVGTWQQILTMLKVFSRTIKLIVSKRFFRLTIYLTILNFATMFRTLGINIALAKLLYFQNQTRIHGYEFLHISALQSKLCSFDDEVGIYQNFFLLSIHMLFSLIMLLFIIDGIGRRISIFVGLWFAGIGSLLLAHITNNFTASAIASALVTMGFIVTESTTFIVTVESFPTAIRATVVSITCGLAYVTVAFMYLFLDSLIAPFFSVMGTFLLGASLIAYCLPELKNRPMVE